MAALSSLTPAMLDRAITQSLDRVFSVLIKSPVTLLSQSEDIDPSRLPEGIQIMGCVGFVGEINGIIHLRFSEEFAAVATSRVLGMSVPEVRAEGREVIKDTIGEITNMSVGGFKNVFCDLGFPCKLTLPTIVWGEHLSAPRAMGATRRVYAFENLGHCLLADLQLKDE